MAGRRCSVMPKVVRCAGAYLCADQHVHSWFEGRLQPRDEDLSNGVLMPGQAHKLPTMRLAAIKCMHRQLRPYEPFWRVPSGGHAGCWAVGVIVGGSGLSIRKGVPTHRISFM
jgi:hypothetical protein